MVSSVSFEELNEDDVFINQSQRGRCTLASATMVFRRAALISGDENWNDITEGSLARVAWRPGLPFTFTYNGMTMVHDYVRSTETLKELLEEHPEGIVAYDSYYPHAILLTDYDSETDTFFCSDPTYVLPASRYPVSDSLIQIQNVSAVWYLSESLGYVLADQAPEFPDIEENNKAFYEQKFENPEHSYLN